MSKTTSKFSPEVRARAVRMVLYHEGEDPSRWAAALSISATIGCSAHTLLDWVKRVEVDSGRRAGVPSDMAEKLKALEQAQDHPAPPLDASPKRSLTLTPDGQDTVLLDLSFRLKSFGDGQGQGCGLGNRQRMTGLKYVGEALTLLKSRRWRFLGSSAVTISDFNI
jgi:transposase